MNHFETDLKQFKALFSYVTRVFKWRYLLPLVMIAWQSNVVQAAHTNLKIMAVGDSITEGTKGESSYRQSLNNLLVNANCDFDWVGSQTQVHGHNNGNVYTQPHEGYSGHTADDLLNGGTRNGHVQTGINDMLAHNPPPGVVLLHAGSNDVSLGQSTASTVSDLEDLVAVIAADPNRLVFVANVIPWYIDSNGNGVKDNEWADINALTNAINASNQSTANGKLGSYSNVILVDMRDPAYGYAYTDMHVNNDGSYEGIHPGPSGEDKIAQAFFDAMDDVDACVPPSTIINPPGSSALNFTSQTVSFTGYADDAGINGIDKVRIAIQNNGTGEWFNFNTQTFVSPVRETDATLTNTSTNYTDWNITATLPFDGSFTFLALAVDNSGNEDYSGGGLWPIRRQFTVSSTTDNTPPDLTIDYPDTGVTIEPSTTLFGTVTDSGGSGIQYIRVAIKNNGLNLWYNFSNETFGPWASTNATLVNQTTSYADWTVDTSLQTGEYTIVAHAIDNDGNYQTKPDGSILWKGTSFTVSSSSDDTTPPSVEFTVPTPGNTLGTSPTLSGTANDTGGSGIKNIRVAVKSLDLNLWYDFVDGTFGSWASTNATLANQTNSYADWTVSTSLPTGQYTIVAHAVDNDGNYQTKPDGSILWKGTRFTVSN